MPGTILGQSRHLSIGINNKGLAIGNPKKYSGIKFSLWDKSTISFNGLKVAARTEAGISNGLKFGLEVWADFVSNGVSIGGLGVTGTGINGLTIAGIAAGADCFNGFVLSPFRCLCRNAKRRLFQCVV